MVCISYVFAANSQKRISIGKRYNCHPILSVDHRSSQFFAIVDNDIQNVLPVFNSPSDGLELSLTQKRKPNISLAFFPFKISVGYFLIEIGRFSLKTLQKITVKLYFIDHLCLATKPWLVVMVSKHFWVFFFRILGHRLVPYDRRFLLL